MARHGLIPPPGGWDNWDPQWATPQQPLPPASNPYRKPVRQNCNIVSGASVVVFVMLFALPLLLYVTLDALGVNYYSLPEAVRLSIDMVLYVMCMLLPLLLVKAMTGIPTRVAFPMRAPRAGVMVSGLMMCLGVAVIGQLISALLYTVVAQTSGVSSGAAAMQAPGSVLGLVLFAVSDALCPAVFEELLYRGVVMQSLRRFGDGFALVCSSLLFGLVHGNLQQAPNATLMGLAIGYLVLYSGSLIPGMVVHFVNNGFVVALEILSLYSMKWATTINTLSYPVFMVLGVIGLIWMSARYGVPFRTRPSAYPLRESQKYGIFFTAGMTLLFLLLSVAVTFRLYEVLFVLYG